MIGGKATRHHGPTDTGSTAHASANRATALPCQERRLSTPPNRTVGQQGASLHMKKTEAGGAQIQRVPVRRRSMALLVATILGYCVLGWACPASQGFAEFAAHFDAKVVLGLIPRL